jgi:hypothetical protein
MKPEKAGQADRHLDCPRANPGGPVLASIAKLRTELETIPAVSIEQAAELLELSVRTLYRRRAQFEHKRRKGHLYFTLRSIKQYIELEQYNPAASFDITIPDSFDNFDNRLSDNRNR